MESTCPPSAPHKPPVEVPGKRSYDSGPAAAPGSYDSTMTDFEAEIAAQEVQACPVEAALAKGEPRWQRLQDLLDSKLSRSPCSGAAERLVTNHAAVL